MQGLFSKGNCTDVLMDELSLKIYGSVQHPVHSSCGRHNGGAKCLCALSALLDVGIYLCSDLCRLLTIKWPISPLESTLQPRYCRISKLGLLFNLGLICLPDTSIHRNSRQRATRIEAVKVNI